MGTESTFIPTPQQLQAAAVIDDSVDGNDPGKYAVAESLWLDPDLVDRVLATYASWLRQDTYGEEG